MSSVKSMGDLRMFLVETMQGVRDGTVEPGQAGQIAKLAAQINASVHAEIAARAHLGTSEEKPFNNLALVESQARPDEQKETRQVSGRTDNAPETSKAHSERPSPVIPANLDNRKSVDKLKDVRDDY